MPDSRASCDAPRGWDDAFAALPLEMSPADTWTSVARRLPSRPSASRRKHRPYWFAMAAAVALAAVIPVFRWSEREVPPAPSSAAIAPAPPTSSSSSVAAPSFISPDAAPTAVAATGQAQSKTPSPTTKSAASSISATTAATAASAPRVAKQTRSRKAPPSQSKDPAPTATEAAEQDHRLENLYAESARLEAILAQLEEPRAGSATMTALSAELQDRIADIDGALSQPDMPSASQLDLWQQRVDALRQLTGVETTQRWMAAQGTATEGPLAQVY
ncbi:hypothetical protein [Pseudoxanthomonas sp. UTMC 1351]|uniref:hypothetical protein n=1 Tax=Pseudoxanthomonas sp. UTMC 1351 TaxID=2695853 RepID=UPI0034CD4643